MFEVKDWKIPSYQKKNVNVQSSSQKKFQNLENCPPWTFLKSIGLVNNQFDWIRNLYEKLFQKYKP